jgi:hypothetical protein
MIGWALRDAFETVFWLCRPRPVVAAGRRLVRGQFLQRVWRSPSLARTPSDQIAVVLGRIDTTRIWTRRDVTPDECAAMLAEALALPQAGGSAAGSLTQVYELDVVVTEMLPEAWWRGDVLDGVGLGPPWFLLALLAWSGVGHAWLQVEGVVRSLGGGEPVMAFAHRTRRSAYFDLPDFRRTTISRPIEQLCTMTAVAILREIRGALVK